MLALLGWLAAGAAAGLSVRALAPDRRHLGAVRLVILGVVGGGLGGLLGTAVLGDSRSLAVWVLSAVGGGVVPWLYLAYGVRWTRPVYPAPRPATGY